MLGKGNTYFEDLAFDKVPKTCPWTENLKKKSATGNCIVEIVRVHVKTSEN